MVIKDKCLGKPEMLNFLFPLLQALKITTKKRSLTFKTTIKYPKKLVYVPSLRNIFYT